MADIMKRKQETPTLPSLFGGTWDPFRWMREMARWDPFRELSTFSGWEPGAFAPCFDVKENAEAYVLQADLPGIAQKDLKVTLTGNRLSVSGKREQEQKREEEQHYAVERSYGSFNRSFTLPEGIDASKVHAELKDGVLTLMLPKRPEVKAKEVTIKVK